MKQMFFLLTFIVTSQSFSQAQEFNLEDIFTNSEFYPKKIDAVQWFDNGDKFSYLDYDASSGGISIFQYDARLKEESVLLSIDNIREALGKNDFLIDNYIWSPLNNYILFTATLSSRSLKNGGDFFVYDVKGKEVILNVTSELEQVNIKFSPDETMVGFVRGNNLFAADLKTGKEVQLTFDGNEVILNGVFDWVYEEEFSIIEAWEWSPDSKGIAFWRFDQSGVPVFPIVEYDSLYNYVNYQRYPKVGTNISEVKIGVVDVSNTKTVWMDIGTEKNIYVPRIKYTSDPGILSIQRLNRLQNKLELLFADVNTGRTSVIITEEDEHWVDIYDHLTFLKNSELFIWPSERDGFLHMYLYDYAGNVINQITRGNFEAGDLLAIDEELEIVYYTSNERSVLNKDLYSINLNGSSKKRITESPGTHGINLSLNNKYFIDEFSTANSFTATELFSIQGDLIYTFYKPDMSFVNDYNFTPMEFLEFNTSDNVQLNSFIIKPPDFDSTKKYPLVIFNYSGPGSQEAEDKWKGRAYFIYQYLAQAGFVVFTVDNRGTGGRGKEFEHLVYKNLGEWELNDIIEGIKYLDKEGFIDTGRVGIFGSSYGGYMAALALLKAPEHFKLGAVVSAVTHWKFYDAIYTERYMQNEELNPEGYEKSAPLNFAGNLSGKLLIVHGTSDDNVHFHNSVELIERLTRLSKTFDLMIYPGKKHGGFGKHYYYLLTDYIINNL
ncbi:MAG: S9 family peptidase [Ignavibacteriaceae bacterium]